VGGGEQELDVPGRLFERLEQGVEGGAGEHVDFVDDVDLVAVARRQVPGCLAQGADVVDAVVRGGVDLLQLDVCAGGQVGAGRTYAARLGRRPLLAVERAGKDACAGGFSATARAGEEERVRHPARLERVDQRPDHVLLPGQVGKPLRPVLAGEDEVRSGHRR